MKRTIIAASLLLLVELSTGCNKGKDDVSVKAATPKNEVTASGALGKDEVLPNGTKLFGDMTLEDGTEKIERMERPNGAKSFDITKLPDGTVKIGRIESTNGERQFEDTVFPDRTQTIVRVEMPDGTKWFDLTVLPDGTQKAGLVEYPDGAKKFDVTVLPNGTVINGRIVLPNGDSTYNVTRLQDGTIKSEQAHGAAAMRAVSQGTTSELQILATRKQFMNAHSSAFNPVLTVRNDGNRDLMFSLDWYATDGAVDVQQGNCTGMSVRPGTTAEIDCGPMVIGHPDAKITLGQPSVTVR